MNTFSLFAVGIAAVLTHGMLSPPTATFSPGGEPVLVFPENTPQVEWVGENGRYYAVRFSTDLENWQWDTIALPGDPDAKSSRDLSAISISERMFVTIVDDENSPDSDGDGLVDVLEIAEGTSVIDPDSDGDSMSDGFEKANGFDPLIPEFDIDGDLDGFLNRWEIAFGTDGDDAESIPASDSGSGEYFVVDAALSADSAFEKQSIATAIAESSDLAIIEVRPGVYTDYLYIPPGKRLHIFSSAGAGTTQITAESTYPVTLTSSSVFSGFTVNAADSFSGIITSNSSADEVTAVITGCIFTGFYNGIYLSGTNAVVSRCTIIGNDGAGIYVEDADIQLTLTSSILAQNGSGGDLEGPGTSAATISQSVISAGQTGGAQIDSSVVVVAAGADLGLTPDFHLRDDSVAVGIGGFSPGIDIDGEPYGDDAGADEFVDTDGDLLPDWFEGQYAGDLLPDGDLDGDLLVNLDEFRLGTDLLASDSDSDSMPDGYEVVNGYDPAIPDIDVDPDGDGFLSGWEAAFGTDSTDPTSFPTSGLATGEYYVVDASISPETEYVKQTVTAAVAAAEDFAVIEVRPGVYEGAITVARNRRLHLFSSAGAHNTTIVAQGSDPIRILDTAVISGFTTAGDGSSGIYFVGASGHDPFAEIRGCVLSGFYNGIYVYGAHCAVSRCTITGNRGSGIYISNADSESRITGTILAENEDFQDIEFYGSAQVSITDGIVVADRVDAATLGENVTVLPQGSTLGLSGTFHLHQNSPAIGAGIAVPGSDLDGEPFGDDAGADEFVDSDGDSLPDWFEALASGDILPTGDLDGDSLPNGDEYLLGSDPNSPDSDGDTMRDGFEVANGFDPLTPELYVDADGDTFLNAWEKAFGTAGDDIASKPSPMSAGSDATYYIIDPSFESETEIEKYSLSSAIYDEIEGYSIVEVRPGTHFGGYDIPEGKKIHFFSTSGAAVTAITSNFAQSTIRSDDDIVVSGFTLEGGIDSSIFVGGTPSARPYMSIHGCILADLPNRGIHVTYAHGIISRCTIVGNGAEGIYINDFGPDVLIRGSILADNEGSRDLDGRFSFSNRAKISNSLTNPGRTEGAFFDGTGLSLPIGSDLGIRPDFHLLADSPARSIGAPAAGGDIDGEPAMVDAGADEFVDSDLDLLPDWFEALVGSDIAGSGDLDSDGLNNADEYSLGTQIGLADTDGDSMDDGYEVANGFDPFTQELDIDPDNDGFTNRWELAFGSNGSDPSKIPTAASIGGGGYFIVDANLETETSFEKQTVSNAIAAAADQAIIQVAPGTYAETLVIPSDKRIFLTSSSGAGSTILTSDANYTLTVDSDSVILGFTFAGAQQAGLLARGSAAMRPRVDIRGCILSGLRLRGIYFDYAFGSVSRCTITDNGSNGIYIDEYFGSNATNSDIVITGTILAGNRSASLDLDGRILASRRAKISNSVIYSGRTEFAQLVDDVLVVANGSDLGFRILSTSYHLRPDSIARGSGLSTSGIDMDGEPFLGDAGADEYIDSDGDLLPDRIELIADGDLTPDGDYDSDLISNLDEYELGTGIFIEDTDGDSMRDGFEVDNMLDPLVEDLELDFDNDGFTNLWEKEFGTFGDDPSSLPVEGGAGGGGYFLVDGTLGAEDSFNKLTITSAIEAAGDLSVIEVRPGSYSGSILIPLGKRVHLFSTEGAARTEIVATSNAVYAIDIESDSTISGFKITGGRWSGVNIAPASQAIAPHCRINGCIVSGLVGDGIRFRSNASGEVSRCTIVGNQDAGVDVGSSFERPGQILIRGTILTGSKGASDISGNDVNTAMVSVENSIVGLGLTGMASLGSGVKQVASSDSIGIRSDFHVLQGGVADSGGTPSYGVDIDGEPFYSENGAVDYSIGVDQVYDADADSLPDWFEDAVVGDIAPNDDFDNDMLSNIDEYIAETNVGNPDTDGDSLLDGFEVANAEYDPFVADLDVDTDQDGFGNRWEAAFATDGSDPGSIPSPGNSNGGGILWSTKWWILKLHS